MEAVEYFDYLHLRFDVTKARDLSRDYIPAETSPDLGWLSPFSPRSDPAKVPREPVLFATVVCDETPVHVLIDGDRMVQRAVREGRKIKIIILNLADSMEVLTTIKRQMKGKTKKIRLIQ